MSIHPVRWRHHYQSKCLWLLQEPGDGSLLYLPSSVSWHSEIFRVTSADAVSQDDSVYVRSWIQQRV